MKDCHNIEQAGDAVIFDLYVSWFKQGCIFQQECGQEEPQEEETDVAAVG
jgi:hypothetical protein